MQAINLISPFPNTCYHEFPTRAFLILLYLTHSRNLAIRLWKVGWWLIGVGSMKTLILKKNWRGYRNIEVTIIHNVRHSLITHFEHIHEVIIYPLSPCQLVEWQLKGFELNTCSANGRLETREGQIVWIAIWFSLIAPALDVHLKTVRFWGIQKPLACSWTSAKTSGRGFCCTIFGHQFRPQ